jgi:chitodextrinase
MSPLYQSPYPSAARARRDPLPLRHLLHLLVGVAAIVGTFSAQPGQAQTCDRSGCAFTSCGTPAVPVPSGSWGEIQPAEGSFAQCTSQGGPLFCRDSTSFNEFVSLYRSYPWFMAVDTQNGYVLTALAYGLEIWDARSTPANPTPLGQIALSDFPVPPANPEIKRPLQYVAAPDGVDSVAAIAGASGLGIGIINLADKTLPKFAYQSYQKDSLQVYAATLGGRQYAFLTTSAYGLLIYDMTQALQFDHCAEAVPAPAETVQCPGVYQGRLGSRPSAFYVGGVDNYVVLSSGTTPGVEIWDVTQPTNAVLRLSALPSDTVYGVAMWKQGGSYYLALRTGSQGRFYDVSCIVSGCGGGLGSPLASRPMDTGTSSFTVTFSRSGTTPFVYFGSDDTCMGGGQREWLFDVTNPASPRDVSPPNYWSWYYGANPTGFNYITPRSGKFVGGYFYRAALSLLDIHKWNPGGGPTPSIFVEGPEGGKPGDHLTFTANAAICTPNPSGWSWTTSGGAISGSSTGSSVQVSWAAAGEQTVTATNSACGGATGLRHVEVSSGTGTNLAASFGFSPASPAPGQPVAFDASRSAGNPTQYSWTFGDGRGGAGRMVSHAYAAAGNYQAVLTVTAPGTDPSCPGGTCTARAAQTVAVGAPAPPDATFSTDAPCVNMFGFDQCQATAGQQVGFTARSTEPFTYTWDFGDGTHAAGRTATHAWSQPGTYTAQLAVGNGQQTASASKVFQVSAAPSGCVSGPTRLCFQGNRFQVDVTWTAPGRGSGPGEAVPLTSDTGFFWFFSQSNVEMLIKVLDGCAVNQHFWVFAGGLTNVEVEITVTDTRTGAMKTYRNPQNTPFQPTQDTSAFPCS